MDLLNSNTTTMKKIISITALLAAGSAFANAEEYTASTPEKTNQGNYYGFCLAFDNATYLTTDVPAGLELNLDSIALQTRSDGSLEKMKIAVYEYTEDYTTGDFLGTSSVATFATNTNITLTFNDITVNSSSRYQFLFVKENATAESLATFDGYKTNAMAWGVAVTNGFSASIPKGWGTYKSSGIDSWEGQYIPVVSFTLSTIPEPSTFGLLAGLGALALVGTRRRRK